MLCKLCNQDKKLIDAHIIPLKYFETGSDLKSYGAGMRPSRRPKGPYDKEILCAECDGVIGKLDSHSYDFFLSAPDSVELIHDPEDKIHAIQIYQKSVKGYEINKFVYSVLWRASISTRPEFSRVSLGKYEDEIMKLMFDTSEKNILQFPIILGKIENCPVKKYAVSPQRTRNENGVNVYRLYFGQYLVTVKVDSRNDFKMFPIHCCLGVNNRVPIIKYNYIGSNEQKANLRVLRPDLLFL